MPATAALLSVFPALCLVVTLLDNRGKKGLPMDFLSLLEQYSARLNAGAVGSLIAVLTAKQDPSVSVYTRLFCGWSVAVFGTPLAMGVLHSFEMTKIFFEKLHPRGESETAVAFLVGLTGWHIVDYVNKNAKRLSKRRIGDD